MCNYQYYYVILNAVMDGVETFEKECTVAYVASTFTKMYVRHLIGDELGALAAVTAMFAFSIEEDDKFNKSGPAGSGSF